MGFPPPPPPPSLPLPPKDNKTNGKLLKALPKGKRNAVELELGKSLPAAANKRVKQAALNAAHKDICLDAQKEWFVNGNSDIRKGPLMKKNTDLSGIFTSPTPKRCLNKDQVVMSVGNFVEVTRDKRPNMNSEGGSGRITAIKVDDGLRTCTVKYTLTSMQEKQIPFNRLTSIAMPYHDACTPTRPSNKMLKTPDVSLPVLGFSTKLSLPQRLLRARASVKHRKLGWMLKEDEAAEGKVLSVQEKRDRMLERWSLLCNFKSGILEGKGFEKGTVEHKYFFNYNAQVSSFLLSFLSPLPCLLPCPVSRNFVFFCVI